MSAWRCFCKTFLACITNLSCAPFFLIAVLFYAFYYCWPYMAQLPLHIDSVIVDEDASPLSRRVVSALLASPDYRIIQVLRSRPPAEELMRQRKISAIIGIPENFERDALTGVPTALTVLADGSFIVSAHTAMSGAAAPLAMLANAVALEQLTEHGISPAAIQTGAAPAVEVVAMYNTIAGYLSFAVSIVFVIIFQTIMICGFSMLLNDWFSREKYPEPLTLAFHSPVYLLALAAPVFCLCLLWILFVEGWVFYWQDMNSFQNIGGTLLVGLFFAWAVASLGLLTGMAFKSSKFAIHAVVTSSLPCVFVSGNLFPWQDIPVYMQAFAALMPSTPGVDAMLRASQAGASPLEIFPYLMHLLALGLLYFSIAWLLAKKCGQEYFPTAKLGA